jgi:hypothetical protein
MCYEMFLSKPVCDVPQIWTLVANRPREKSRCRAKAQELLRAYGDGAGEFGEIVLTFNREMKGR